MNYVVDLGWRGRSWMRPRSGVFDVPTMDAYFVDIRTRINDKMQEAQANSWDVSPIFKWVQSGDHGYGIVIKHLNAGVPTGREWFIVIPGLESATTYSDPGILLQSFTLAAPYFRNITNPGSISNFQRGNIGLHYHTGGLSTTYDLTGVVNDLDVPTTTPGADIAAFMPSFATHPHIHGPMLPTNASALIKQKWCMVFNHDVPFIALYNCDREEGSGVTEFGIIGDVAVPRDTADTYKDCAIAAQIDTNGSDNTLSATGLFASWLTPAGEQHIQAAWNQHSQYNIYNTPVDPGEAYSDAMPLRDMAQTFEVGDHPPKGWTRKDVFAEQGWYNGQHYRMFDSKFGKQLKILPNHTVPWVTTPEPTPFAGWPLDPQDRP